MQNFLLQIGIDTQLKEDAEDVLYKIGIDIPIAVKMFLKALVREQCLPFSTNVIEPDTDEQKKREDTMSFYARKFCYFPPNGDDKNILTVLPLENGNHIQPEMYMQLVDKIPAGKITCFSKMDSYLEKIYKRKIQIPSFCTLPYMDMDMNNNMIPYWRIVSRNGVLSDGRGGSRETQKDRLIEEGIPVVPRGSLVGSYKVENYKDYMFDYDTLQLRYINSTT